MQPRLIAAISNGWGDVIAIAVAVVAFSVWERRRTKADPSLVAREARYGRRLLSYGVVALAVLIVACPWTP